MSQPRARSKEAKEKQIKRIINEARDLFYEAGSSGFSMRSLAKRLDMSQGNIYNYWSSKRDLWYAIMQHDFTLFENDLNDIVVKHEGLFIDLLGKLAYFYLNFSNTNYKQYQMMFVLPPPPAEGKSEKEAGFEPQTINLLFKIVEKYLGESKLKGIDSRKLTLYLWSIMHGAALVSKTVVFSSDSESMFYGSVEEFFEFVIEQTRAILQQFL